MALRSELQSLLETILESRHVYFQKPPTVQMVYPCIMYKLDDVKTDHANNKVYKRVKRYQVTVIDPNPDTLISDKVGELPKCAFDRFYTSEGLNHYVYNLYF